LLRIVRLLNPFFTVVGEYGLLLEKILYFLLDDRDLIAVALDIDALLGVVVG
jgi:hypothetical protein